MKFSVITVSYNAEQTIGRSIESFLNQTHPDRELIVIDGASTDGTCDVVRRYQSDMVHLKSEADKGIYDALNKGIKQCTGDVIGILHANDHFADDGVLARVAANMSGDLDAVFADVTFFAPGNEDRVLRRYRSARFRPSKLKYGLMPAHPSLFLKRGVFDRFGCYRTDLKIAGDFEFIARIFKDGSLKFRHVDEVWTRMQAGGASTSGLRSKVQINREVLRALQINGIRSSMMHLLLKYPAKLGEMLFT